MTCFVDIDAGLSISYEELFRGISTRKFFRKFVYTKEKREIIITIMGAILYGQHVILFDSDFSHNELSSLGISEADLQSVLPIDKNISVKTIEDFRKIAWQNIDKTCIGIYTSGTTGKPKRFDHSLRSLLRNIKANDKHKNDVWGFAYNITHYAGVQVLLQAIFNQNLLVNLFDRNMKNADTLMRQYGCTCISATPTFYRNSLFTVSTPNEDVKFVTFGGERFSNDLAVKTKEKFPKAKLRNVYASTEIGSLLSGESDSFSIPAELAEYIKFSAENHLLINKRLIFNENVKTDWYDTGDIVSLNEDGTFRFLTREADFINLGGYKVMPSEVEDVIGKVPGVTDVRVYGRDNSVMGKILVADIVSSAADKKSLRELIVKAVKENLQEFKLPRIMKFVEKIDYSRTGKKVH